MAEQFKPKYDSWIWVVVIGALGIALAMGAILAVAEEWAATVIVFAVIAFDVLLVWLVQDL